MRERASVWWVGLGVVRRQRGWEALKTKNERLLDIDPRHSVSSTETREGRQDAHDHNNKQTKMKNHLSIYSLPGIILQPIYEWNPACQNMGKQVTSKLPPPPTPFALVYIHTYNNINIYISLPFARVHKIISIKH